jgi:hypothetical protein
MAIQLDTATLQAALVGYQQQLETIQQKMAEIRRSLGKSASGPAAKANGVGAAPAAATKSTPRRHRMSEEGRARIAAAQRARWAKSKRAAKKAERAEE